MNRPTVRLALALSLAAPALAQETGPQCVQPQQVDPYQLLRRLSLDLRGYPPSMAEYGQLDSGQSTALDIAKTWVGTFDPDQPHTASQEGFRQQMRWYHETLLWPNITGYSSVKLSTTTTTLNTTTLGSDRIYYDTFRNNAYVFNNPDWAPSVDAGVLAGLQTSFGPECIDQPQPASGYYTGDNDYRPIPQSGTLSDGGTYQWVGYRDVTPYWGADAGTVKVCAYEAQETAWTTRVSQAGKVSWLPEANPDAGTVYSCDSLSGATSPWCGCGPNLRYCYTGQTSIDVENEMDEQLLRLVDQVTVGGRPYTDVIGTTNVSVSGRLAFWKQYLSPMNNQYALIYQMNDPGETFVPAGQLNGQPGQLPVADYNDRNWYPVAQTPGHAGVLTLPVYLLRFQSNRGRANRFRNAFLCNYFVPPDQLTDAPPACSPTTNDLMNKCNCRLCHATLEPLADHWGRFSMQGLSQLTADGGFPDFDPTCVPKTDGGIASSARCQRFYAADNSWDLLASNGTSPDGQDHHYAGWFLGDLYWDVHVEAQPNSAIGSPQVPVLQVNANGGPALFMNDYVNDPGHEFATCVVSNLFNYLVQRPMRVTGAENDEVGLQIQLAQDLIGSNYDFQKLVMEIVALPQYGRIR